MCMCNTSDHKLVHNLVSNTYFMVKLKKKTFNIRQILLNSFSNVVKDIMTKNNIIRIESFSNV